MSTETTTTERAEDGTPIVRTWRVQYAHLDEEQIADIKADENEVGKDWALFFIEDAEVARFRTANVVAIMQLDNDRPVDPFVAVLRAAFSGSEAQRADDAEAAAQERERQAQPGADWSIYADCPVCGKPTGESCVVGNLNLYRWPHQDRPLLIEPTPAA